MTPLARWEWLVGLSPVATTILAYLALTNLSLEAPAVGFTAGALDGLCAAGMPAFGTCAGAIMLATHIASGRADQRDFETLDIDVRRNGYGRQIDSFETEIDVDGLDAPFHATFIRAPIIERTGDGVQVLAAVGDNAVFVRAGAVMATTFHPELGADDRLHRLFLDAITSS